MFFMKCDIITKLFVFSCLFIDSAYCDIGFTIAALFNEASADVALAFKYGVQWRNIYRREGIYYGVDIQYVSRKNIFLASKTVCNITNSGAQSSKVEPGVIALFGPEGLKTAAITQSICKKLEIPHIQTTWQPSTNYPPLISLNFYPAAELLAEGFATIVRHMKWRSYAVVYEHDEALIRLQGILKIADVEDSPVTVRQLDPGFDYRPMLKGLKDSGVRKIILDCDTDQILNVLQQAKHVDLLKFTTSFLLTSLDAHTLDYTELDTTANITMVRLFDPSNELLRRNIDSWKVGEQRYGRPMDVDVNTVQTEAVLMIDAVNLLIESVNTLHKTETVAPRPMDCFDTDTWEGGYRIAAYMKEHKMHNPIAGPIGFDEFGKRVNFTLHVVELNADRIVKATWTPANGTRLNFTISASERRQLMLKSLQKQKIVVSTKFVNPYFMMRNRSRSSDGTGSKYQGYLVDLIESISEELNFTYEFTITDVNGKYDANTRTWNGVIGDVVSGVAQLGVCDLTVTYDRRHAVDFSNYFMTLGISILYKKPVPAEAKIFAFLGPLAEDVWTYTATLYLGVSVMLYLVARMAPGDWENPHPCEENPEELENMWNLGNCVWLTLGSIMTQGCDILPKGVSSRMIVAMWWFFALLVTESYKANLVAHLTKGRMGPQIKSLEDLLNQNSVKFGTMINGTTHSFFENANYTLYEQAWQKMSNFKPTTFVKTNTEGVRKVLNKNQNYAFLMESSSMEYEINKYKCELQQIGGLLDSKGYGIAMPIDAPYRDEINDAILKLQESGTLQTMKDRWWKEWWQENNKDETSCEEQDENNDGSMTFKNVGGSFVVLGVGMLMSFLFSLAEFLWNVRNISVEEHISYWEALVIELRFVFNFCLIKKAVKVEVRNSPASREPSEVRMMAERVLHGAGSFLQLDNILDRISVGRD